MKRILFFLLLICLLVISPTTTIAQAPPCSANWWAKCCKCGKCLVVDPLPSFGYCRHCNLLCPDCRKELGDLNKALEKLKGKNRGLKEAYDAFEKSYSDALEKYNDARQKVYGEEGVGLSGLNGSLGKFFGSGFAVLSNATGATKTMKVVANGISIYQTSGASDAAMNWSGAAIDVFTSSENAQKLIRHATIKDAMDMYMSTVNGGGPLDVAITSFNKRIDGLPKDMDDFIKGADFLGLLMDIWGYYQATKELFGDISDIKENYEDLKIAKKEMKKITDSIVKNVDLMICIKETLDSLKSGSLGARGANSQASPQMAVSMLAPTVFINILKSSLGGVNKISTLQYWADTLWELNEFKLESALSQLKQLKTLQQRMVDRIEKDIFPPLIPWVTRRWKEVKPAVLLKSLQKAHAGLKILLSEINRLKALDESIRTDLNAMITGYETDYLKDNSNNPGIISPAKNASGKKIKEEGTPGGTDKWTTTLNEKIKGELGRVNMYFPAGVDWTIDFYTPENKFITNRSSFSKHQMFYDITPGNYNIVLNHVKVENVPVEKGKEIKLKSGFLNLVTRNSWSLYNESKEKFYTSGIKPVKFALPVGTYLLNFEGKDHRVIIKDRVTVKFELPISDLFK